MFEFILILTEKLALLDDDDPNLADSLDEPYLSRIGYGMYLLFNNNLNPLWFFFFNRLHYLVCVLSPLAFFGFF